MFGWLNQAISNPAGFLVQTVTGRKGAHAPEEYKHNVDDDDVDAHLSKHAYERDYDKVDREIKKYGRKVDREASNANATVYVDERTGEPTIAFRGTVPTNMEDLAADAHIAIGSRKHKRFREAEELADKVEKKYKGKKIKLTGHSLGGTQALYVNEKRGHDTKVYQPGASALGTDTVRNKNVEVVRHAGDLVSAGLKRGNEKRTTLTGKRSKYGFFDFLRNHNIF